MLGALASQVLLGRVHEQASFTSLFLLQAFAAMVFQQLNVGSSGVFFLCAFPLSFVALVNPLLSGPGEEFSLWSYAIGGVTPLVTGTQLALSVLDFFVPLVSNLVYPAHIVKALPLLPC